MATRRQPLITPRRFLAGALWPGVFAAGLLCATALLAFGALWYEAGDAPWLALWQDHYLWHVLRFSVWQALLSSALSLGPALLLARALYRRRFPGHRWLLRLCAMTLVLPVLVAVFGLLRVYGREGWLAHALALLGLPYRFSPYGLPGILLAHVFFNLPLATRLFLQTLQNIPTEQRQLAAQLGLRSWHFFRWVEWPWLRRQLLPAGALIFMLCFSSFATVLALGGGPQATTLELAIYQALSFDYDPARAALLALLQLCCCLALLLASQRLSHWLAPGTSQRLHWRDPQDSLWSRLCDTLVITLALALLLPPLLAVLADGINPSMRNVFSQPALWQALGTSVSVALAAGMVSVCLTLMLLWSSRSLRLHQRPLAAQWLDLSGMLILAMPGIVLASGFFLLFNRTLGLPSSPYALVVLTNALLALPYASKVLEGPMYDTAARYNALCQSLGLSGWQRLRVVELRALRAPLMRALAFACVLSVGDFGIIALFGSEQFRTLPYYLYQQIGAYRSSEGAVTALILLALCFLLFTLIEKLAGKNDNA
ncbi:thiamine/thiamine pyrophosphate ABC transporter permease ThiP [Dickeya lacustris]|uniref:Thiamine transport system permease protein ThiP n=1 Tax=Dickeya lacustris TaxID=2259638 RepID=A0ABY8G4H9_9GAMM|nr:thiamine/thiamine pyrophosphate ABC transporter permease ThiP [Dickeya lacustris]WFN54857.1 thiamine/thiamine pyrophosphate ABC transporter permease ThiP [Dickeya lacustris]